MNPIISQLEALKEKTSMGDFGEGFNYAIDKAIEVVDMYIKSQVSIYEQPTCIQIGQISTPSGDNSLGDVAKLENAPSVCTRDGVVGSSPTIPTTIDLSQLDDDVSLWKEHLKHGFSPISHYEFRKIITAIKQILTEGER